MPGCASHMLLTNVRHRPRNVNTLECVCVRVCPVLVKVSSKVRRHCSCLKRIHQATEREVWSQTG